MTDAEYLASIATLNASLDSRIQDLPLPTTNPIDVGWTNDTSMLPDPIPEPTAEDLEDGLTVQQTKAVACLISGMSQTKTSEMVGVTRRTICDWIKKPEFVKVMRSRKREALQASMALLQSASVELATTLVTLSKNPAIDPADRIRASVSALKMAREHSVNEEIVMRLDAIEASRNAGPTNGATFSVVKAGAL